MPLLFGTDRGLYRVPTAPLDHGDAEQVLDCGRVPVLTDLNHVDGVFAAGEDAAYRSFDGGKNLGATGGSEGRPILGRW